MDIAIAVLGTVVLLVVALGLTSMAMFAVRAATRKKGPR